MSVTRLSQALTMERHYHMRIAPPRHRPQILDEFLIGHCIRSLRLHLQPIAPGQTCKFPKSHALLLDMTVVRRTAIQVIIRVPAPNAFPLPTRIHFERVQDHREGTGCTKGRLGLRGEVADEGKVVFRMA